MRLCSPSDPKFFILRLLFTVNKRTVPPYKIFRLARRAKHKYYYNNIIIFILYKVDKRKHRLRMLPKHRKVMRCLSARCARSKFYIAARNPVERAEGKPSGRLLFIFPSSSCFFYSFLNYFFVNKKIIYIFQEKNIQKELRKTEEEGSGI